MGDTTASSVWNGVNGGTSATGGGGGGGLGGAPSGGMSDGGSLVGFDEDAATRPARLQLQSNSHQSPSLSGFGSGGSAQGRTVFLPQSFPPHLRPHSPSSVSSYPPPSIGDSNCSPADELGGTGRADAVSTTPPPQMDQDAGPPNGRNLTTVERAEVALRQRQRQRQRQV